MNCDECKEQVFELIEREAIDPDGVGEILERCPECRATFEEMKAALAVAEQLPIEEPPAAVDQAILRAASKRAPRVVHLKKRRLQPVPWAMAAIAMLAVGIGVWTIPRDVQLEGDAAPSDVKYAEDAVMAEPMPEDEDEELDSKAAMAEPASGEAAQLEPVERMEAKSKKLAAKPAGAERRSRSQANEPSAARVAQTPASLPAADMASGGAEDSRSNELAAKASAPSKRERGDQQVAAACQRKVDDIERRARADKDDAFTPEEELAIGKCYQALDKMAEARKWLQRAASHRKTRAQAEEALRELGSE
jgi:hypothetical protein